MGRAHVTSGAIHGSSGASLLFLSLREREAPCPGGQGRTVRDAKTERVSGTAGPASTGRRERRPPTPP
jgi:hypothetical protein